MLLVCLFVFGYFEYFDTLNISLPEYMHMCVCVLSPVTYGDSLNVQKNISCLNVGIFPHED